MRPQRLELLGFTSFKERTVVDFDDAGYFALVGPTGSGKSSIIDAICFALYGSVPRYEDRKLKGAVITQGRLEARVRLDFSVGDASYSAVRVVRRDAKGGATTKEARLERGDEVLAGTGPELTAAAERLIGLTFDHFTTCVVLPQGEFGRFLHANPAMRQELLVDLLDLGLYKEMMQASNLLAARSRSQGELLQSRLDEDLAYATEESLAASGRRREQLRALRARLGEVAPRLAQLEQDLAAARAEATEAQRWAEDLRSLVTPASASELGERLARARSANAKATEAALEAEGKRAAAQAAFGELPERTPLETALADHDRRGALEAKRMPAVALLRARSEAEARAGVARKEAEARLRAAEERASEARARHAARHLAARLEAGRPCPVCLQRVESTPEHPPAPDLAAAEADVAGTRADVEAAIEALVRASEERRDAEATQRALEEQIEEIEARLAGAPSRDEAEHALVGIDRANEALADALRQEKEAKARAREATKEHDEVAGQERALRGAYQVRRDSLAPLGPPAPEGPDLAADWRALEEWAQASAAGQEGSARAARRRADEAAHRRAVLEDTIRQECADCAVELGEHEPGAAVDRALGRAEAEVERVEAGIAEAERLRKTLEELRLEEEVAGALAQHLSAKGFEKWIVNEALRRLVGGASGVLEDLSGGQYSLATDDSGNFTVVDHHNADERRSAKTLSGGETFLASLALALALADQVAELASEGAARLESVFLDEGFGTLDSETLDTVAATVENLAAEGRMVGIVTHVAELAARVPLQYRVTKDVRSSRVDRVLA